MITSVQSHTTYATFNFFDQRHADRWCTVYAGKAEEAPLEFNHRVIIGLVETTKETVQSTDLV